MASPVTVSTHELEKSYSSKRVVNKVNVNVTAGEVVGLLGPNGAGKTTTFYMIVGLIPASGGRVLVGDSDITHFSMHKRSRLGIGYLPQEPSVFRNLSVIDNIKAIVETLPIPRKARKERVEKHLEELHLTQIAKQKAYTLSGGERRRLEISRALVTEPKFLLMDEPFSGVDPINVAEVQKIVLELSEKGIGILITDHSVRETLGIVDRAYLLHNGEVLREGTSDFLINDEVSREFYLGENFNM
ncbi:LPS export ABC transporter ATP-binding protein [Opitutia bacterium ISCC 51]|nr:LPS export ABC transporter ATP-binding protein [Opitutae bacterium ISCC 51]QXD28404.1 LPS export ABC transporter ATP-binding protein [Opitutae bacterium ISCC 52]